MYKGDIVANLLSDLDKLPRQTIINIADGNKREARSINIPATTIKDHMSCTNKREVGEILDTLLVDLIPYLHTLYYKTLPICAMNCE